MFDKIKAKIALVVWFLCNVATNGKLNRFYADRKGKVGVGSIIMLCVGIYVGAYTLPGAINAWIGNGTVLTNSTLNTLFVTVGGIVLVAIVLMAFLKSRH